MVQLFTLWYPPCGIFVIIASRILKPCKTPTVALPPVLSLQMIDGSGMNDVWGPSGPPHLTFEIKTLISLLNLLLASLYKTPEEKRQS